MITVVHMPIAADVSFEYTSLNHHIDMCFSHFLRLLIWVDICVSMGLCF